MPVDDSFSRRQSVAQHSVRISQMHMADPISQLIDGPGKIFPLHHLPCRIKIRTEMLILNDVRRAKKAIRAAADHICVALEAEGHAFRSAKLRNPPKRIDVIIPLAGSIVMLRQRHTELGIVQLNAVDIGVKVTGGIGNGRFQRIRPVRDNVDFIRAQPLSHPDPTPDYLQRGLRHVERTRLLLHVVDAAGSEGRDPVEDFHIIQNELEQYGEPVGRPQLVVLNKCDLMPEKEKQQELVAKFKELGYEAFPVSAATRQGFDKLLDRVVQLLPELPPPRVFMEEEEEEEPSITDMSFTVTQQKGGVFVVEGPAIQRLIDSVNFEDEESMNWFHRQLRDRGIIDELRKKGAKEGSPVQLGDMEFDFIE